MLSTAWQKALMRRLGMGIALTILLAGYLAVLQSCALPPIVLDHSLSIRDDNALIAEVELSLSRAGQVFVEYENPQAGKFRTALSESGAEHRISVARLRAETTYSYAIGIQDASGAAQIAHRGEFRTGPLPHDLATIHKRTSGRSSQPLILTSYDDHFNDYALFWDEAGEIVWYHAHDPTEGFTDRYILRTLSAIEQKPNGNLIYINSWCCITEITPLGEVVRQLLASDEAGIPHHDFALLDDGRVLYLSLYRIVFDDSANGGDAKTPALADELRIWDPESGRVEQVWDSRNFWDIASEDQWDLRRYHASGGWCWMHMNSLSIGPQGNFILSARQRKQIMSIAADFQTIEWQLGGPGSDYRFPNPNDRFHEQHDATQLPNGNILLFDNGYRRPVSEGGKYSRAMEIRLDDERRNAVKAWGHRSDPDVFSPVVSGAARLGNGNTLISFGSRTGHDQPLAVLEVDPQGNELFRVETLQLDQYPKPNTRFAQFRAVGDIGSIMGETMLRAPAARPSTEAFVPDDQQYWNAVQQQQREHRLNRYRLLHEALVSGDLEAPLARSTFDIHLSDRALIYLKRPCDADDTQAKFFLHVFPVDEDDLPPGRRRFGFENFDFPFAHRGEFLNGDCIVQPFLPEYPIDRIRTGQFVSGKEPQWKAEFALDMPAIRHPPK